MPNLKYLLVVLVFTIFVSGCSKSDDDVAFERLEDLNKPQYTIAAPVGAASEPYVGKVFPNAVEKQFSTVTDMIIALETKHVNAIVFTRATF